MKEIQNQLNHLGYNCGTADGDFGRMTVAAVKSFQQSKGLTVDGQVGPQTLECAVWHHDEYRILILTKPITVAVPGH